MSWKEAVKICFLNDNRILMNVNNDQNILTGQKCIFLESLKKKKNRLLTYLPTYLSTSQIMSKKTTTPNYVLSVAKMEIVMWLIPSPLIPRYS